MSRAITIAATTILGFAAAGISSEAMAQRRSAPMTRCGPDLAYLCPIKGYFDMTPFHYNLAIYPGCIKTQWVQTPRGMERRPVLVCG